MGRGAIDEAGFNIYGNLFFEKLPIIPNRGNHIWDTDAKGSMNLCTWITDYEKYGESWHICLKQNWWLNTTPWTSWYLLY